MYNIDDRNRHEVEREDRIEANNIRYLIKKEKQKILNASEEQQIKSLKKIYILYNRLEQVLANEEDLREEEKQDFESVARRIEEISKPIKKEIDTLLEEFDNVSDKKRATKILFKLKEKYIEFENKGFPSTEDKRNFDFVKNSLKKIEIKRLEEENKYADSSWEEYKGEKTMQEDEIDELEI